MEWKRNLIFKPQWFTWVTFVALALWLPIGFMIPESWAWEKGAVEKFQYVLLLFGIFASWRVSRTYRDEPVLSAWWLWSIGAWLLVIGRELSWGRNFYMIQVPGEGPICLGRDEIWFGAYTHFIIYLAFLLLVAGLAWNTDWKRLKETIRIPVIDAVVFVFCFLGFTLFEHDIIDVPDEFNQRMEEVGEVIAYWCLACCVLLNGDRPAADDKKDDVAKE